MMESVLQYNLELWPFSRHQFSSGLDALVAEEKALAMALEMRDSKV